MKYLYRIVNALIAFAAFPCAIFLKFVYFCIATSESLSGVFETLGNIAGNENPYSSVGLEESFSIKDLIEILTGNHDVYKFKGLGGGAFFWPQELEIVDGRINATIALFIATLLIALFIVIWSICSNKRLPVLGASVAGLGTTIGMISCFNSFAAVFESGEINLIKLFTSFSSPSDAGLLTGLVNFLAKDAIIVDEFRLDGVQNAFLFIFIGLIAWTAAYYLIELGDNEEKPEKKKH